MNYIDLTERAASHVRNYLARHGHGIGLRIGVKPTGCSGYKYVVSAAESVDSRDLTFESKGVQIVVDEQSLRGLGHQRKAVGAHQHRMMRPERLGERAALLGRLDVARIGIGRNAALPARRARPMAISPACA